MLPISLCDSGRGRGLAVTHKGQNFKIRSSALYGLVDYKTLAIKARISEISSPFLSPTPTLYESHQLVAGSADLVYIHRNI